MWSKVSILDTMTWEQTPRYLSQILSLYGTVLLSVNYVMVSRVKFLEKLFGGLDKVYKTHAKTSRIAFLLILAHPILLVPQYIIEGSNLATLFVPGIATAAKTAGITALYLYIILIGLAMTKKLPYHIWKKVHEFMGVPFFFAAYHVFNASSDVARFEPLKIWMAVFIGAGLVAYVYKSVLYEYLGPKHHYEVVHNKKVGAGVYELLLKPLYHKMSFEPGEFAFVSVVGHPDIPKEHHPFSISSNPSSNQIRFVYKVFGDYTEKLTKLEDGARIDLYGPYGEFSSHMLDHHKKQIWIGAGVGITPFLSMLQHESFNDDEKKIEFYYCVKKEDELFFDKEIDQFAKAGDDKMVYIKHLSDIEGYLTGDRVHKGIEDISEYAVLMCGPDKMVKGLRDDFVKLGVPEKNIYFEEFNFS